MNHTDPEKQSALPAYLKQRLLRLRRKKGLSQRETAVRLGISQQIYSEYERGITSIPVETCVRLAKLFNVSVDYLVGASNEIREYPVL